MDRDFQQLSWDASTAEDCAQLVRLAIREDLERELDWTTVALVPADRRGAAQIVARQSGIVAGMPALMTALDELHADLTLDPHAQDGQRAPAGTALATLTGQVRDLLTSERILLNLLGRLMGIATLSGAYLDRVAGTNCRLYDTRKTTPGWRRLEKYAVRCGGGHNHRTGLFDAILIKDNHLAQFAGAKLEPAVAAAAVRQAREFLRTFPGERPLQDLLVEIEVDSLAQLAAVLPERPDIVLLDNMGVDQLRDAVALRNATAAGVQLEASGGVNLDTVRELAATGVDRISVGALTHGARSLDVGLDWI